MTTFTGHKYSTGKSDIGKAKDFSWEYPVPDTPFWSSLDFVTGRNFLSCFSDDESQALNLEHSISDNEAKFSLLEQLLHSKLKSEEDAASPDTLYDADYLLWSKIWLGISTMQNRLAKHAEEERTIRMLIEKRKDTSNLSHIHNLAGILLQQEKYAEAEKSEIPVQPWLEGKVGVDSPQALGARKIIAQAVWKQGRVDEAKKLFEEAFRVIDRSGEGQYAVYQDEHRESFTKILEDLEKGQL